MKRFKKLVKAILYMILLCFSFIIGKFLSIFNSNYRNVWLIAERGFDARDNGLAFYEYMIKEHPEENCYYVITKDSPDFKKIKGSWCQYKGIRHYILLAISKYKVSSHDMGYTMDMVIFHWIAKLKLIPGKKIFLQHGIIKDDINWYHADEFHPQLFITSAKNEFDFIDDVYGHEKGIVQLLGMCRYDKLPFNESKVKKQILIMPTWRKYLKDNELFASSDYFHKYQALLDDHGIHQILEQKGYELVFYPHIEMQDYLSMFHTNHPNVKIANFKRDDVGVLLKESALVITDYSSIFFDAVYMHHPVIFYQFDKQKFKEHHYSNGYLDYGMFGPICEEKEQVKAHMEEFFRENWNDRYNEYSDQFFAYRDTNNCKRVYQAIKKL